MLDTRWPGIARESRAVCRVCAKGLGRPGGGVEICPECVRQRWDESHRHVKEAHESTRWPFDLPPHPPRNPDGACCDLCLHECRLEEGEPGYCGIRPEERNGHRKGLYSCYRDPLPTNCVADWVCAGGTGAGYPDYAHDPGPEVGFFNQAVFFEACNFNCLYCQNWSFKNVPASRRKWRSTEFLAGSLDEKTSCISFFGGDPTPQLPYAVKVSEFLRESHPGRILRICWETNGSMNPAWLKRMAKLSLESGGCIKVDLKAWNPQIHRVLCGCDNRQVFENFARLASWSELRPTPPFLVASTPLVPVYVDEEEVFKIASFIAGLNPDIPYTLLAFAPQFHMDNLPTTSRAQAEACLEAAKKAGLRRVRLANRHLILP